MRRCVLGCLQSLPVQPDPYTCMATSLESNPCRYDKAPMARASGNRDSREFACYAPSRHHDANLGGVSVARFPRTCYREGLVLVAPSLPNNPPLGGFFRFWRSLYRPMDRGSSPLILKTWNFSPLSRSAVRSFHFSQLSIHAEARSELARRSGQATSATSLCRSISGVPGSPWTSHKAAFV